MLLLLNLFCGSSGLKVDSHPIPCRPVSSGRFCGSPQGSHAGTQLRVRGIFSPTCPQHEHLRVVYAGSTLTRGMQALSAFASTFLTRVPSAASVNSFLLGAGLSSRSIILLSLRSSRITAEWPDTIWFATSSRYPSRLRRILSCSAERRLCFFLRFGPSSIDSICLCSLAISFSCLA